MKTIKIYNKERCKRNMEMWLCKQLTWDFRRRMMKVVIERFFFKLSYCFIFPLADVSWHAFWANQRAAGQQHLLIPQSLHKIRIYFESHMISVHSDMKLTRLSKLYSEHNILSNRIMCFQVYILIESQSSFLFLFFKTEK